MKSPDVFWFFLCSDILYENYYQMQKNPCNYSMVKEERDKPEFLT